MKKIIIGIFCYTLLANFPFTVSANDQKVVIGMDVGGGSFSTVDEVRKKEAICTICPEVKSVSTNNGYLEWYLFDSLGIGYRASQATEGYQLYTGSLDLTFKWTSSNSFLTGNWIFWGENEYTRAGAIIGAGSSKYKLDITLETSSASLELPQETSGSASMFGIFLDWGGESFGARLGYDVIATTLDPLVSTIGSTTTIYNVDGSYSAGYLGLRWAW